jgi:hypothetical protein
MSTKKILKICLLFTVVAISFLGVTYTRHVKKIAGETIVVNTISLGRQAQAYCYERGGPQRLNGRCNGSFDSFGSGCYAWINNNPLNCSDALDLPPED